MKVAAIVVAGGSGTRLGGSVPKQYLDLCGVPVLLWSVETFASHPRVDAVVVVLPAEDAAHPPPWLRRSDVRITAGGAERSDSVARGIECVPPGTDLVLVHDAARPLLPSEVVNRVLDAAREGPAIAALPARDTVKEVSSGRIVATVDRARIWLAQTPQAFPLQLLRDLHRRARCDGLTFTDDAALCERYEVPVRVVEGALDNLKITTAEDLATARALASAAGKKPTMEHSQTPPERSTFNILFVCTGNTCRSPMAEALARDEANRRGWTHLAVGSAGVAAEPGSPATPEARAVAARRGLQLESHRARRLSRREVGWADLILVMSPSHLDVVAELGGGTRAALLDDFAAGGDGAGEGRGIPDPFGGDESRYAATLEALDRLVGDALDRLVPILEP